MSFSGFSTLKEVPVGDQRKSWISIYLSDPVELEVAIEIVSQKLDDLEVPMEDRLWRALPYGIGYELNVSYPTRR